MNFKRYGLPEPKVASLSGYGNLLSSGLTDSKKHIFNDAFLPCRNLMFLTVAAGYAFQCGASAVGIGLLDEAFSLFPDQGRSFLLDTEALLSKALARPIKIIAPLMTFSKADVVRIAKAKGITQTYSCHAGVQPPCGICVACREYIGVEV
jgi:7-cyano-7-deazaguanine synthase